MHHRRSREEGEIAPKRAGMSGGKKRLHAAELFSDDREGKKKSVGWE